MFNGLSDQECIDLKEYRRNAERARVLYPIRFDDRSRIVRPKKGSKIKKFLVFLLCVFVGYFYSIVFLTGGV